MALVAVALALRALAAAAAPVSDDLLGWQNVAAVLAVGQNPYEVTTRLNWPPLWMMWIGAADAVSRLTGISFAILVRLLPFAADAAIALVLLRLSPTAAWLFAVHPVALTTTGAQAQFDTLPALFLLLATVLLDRARPRRDGLAGGLLGLGAAFKTWPLFVAPALVAGVAGWGRRARMLAIAAAIPAFLLVPVALTAPEGFRKNVLHYASYPGWWGFTALGIVFPLPALRALGGLAHSHGRMLLLLGLAFSWWRASRLNSHDGVRMALLAFLVFTPGFGPQYLFWLLPLACLARGGAALAWHLSASITVSAAFFVLPRLPVDPRLGAGQAAIAGNLLLNQLNFPVWVACVLWFAWLTYRSWKPTVTAAG